MKDIAKLVGVLTLISAIAGLMLSFTNKVTATPIETAQQSERVQALAEVLPAFDNNPNQSTNVFTEGGEAWVFFRATKAGQFVGAAFESTSQRGYGGAIRIMVGLNADNTVRQIKILEQQETPGLGSKIMDPAFKDQFCGRSASNTTWKAKKDGGDIDAITGATISSRAVADALARGLDAYMKHAAEISRP